MMPEALEKKIIAEAYKIFGVEFPGDNDIEFVNAFINGALTLYNILKDEDRIKNEASRRSRRHKR